MVNLICLAVLRAKGLMISAPGSLCEDSPASLVPTEIMKSYVEHPYAFDSVTDYTDIKRCLLGLNKVLKLHHEQQSHHPFQMHTHWHT